MDMFNKKLFMEPGFCAECEIDPFEVSDAGAMLAYLKEAHA